MSHGLPEQIYVVKFSSNGKERFIIGKIIRITDMVKLVDDRGINRTPHITGFENFAGDGNDYRIITDQGIIGPVKSGSIFQFDQVVGIGSREIMSPGLPEPEQIRVVKFVTIAGITPSRKEKYIIGKIIKEGDVVNLSSSGAFGSDPSVSETARITGFENETKNMEGMNLYHIDTSKGKIGYSGRHYNFEHVVGIGSREIMLAPADPAAAAAPSSGRSWGSPGAPTVMSPAPADPAAAAAAPAPAAPARATGKISWGSPGAPTVMSPAPADPAAAAAAAAAPARATGKISWGSPAAPKIGGKKTRRRRINRRRKSQKKIAEENRRRKSQKKVNSIK